MDIQDIVGILDKALDNYNYSYLCYLLYIRMGNQQLLLQAKVVIIHDYLHRGSNKMMMVDNIAYLTSLLYYMQYLKICELREKHEL